MTGRAMARPVRIGLVFEPSAEMLRLAVEQATLLWAGQYQPFFHPGDLERIERVSRGWESMSCLRLTGPGLLRRRQRSTATNGRGATAGGR